MAERALEAGPRERDDDVRGRALVRAAFVGLFVVRLRLGIVALAAEQERQARRAAALARACAFDVRIEGRPIRHLRRDEVLGKIVTVRGGEIGQGRHHLAARFKISRNL